MKIELVSDVRSIWRYWSVRITSAALAFLAFVQGLPSVASQVWMVIPADLRARVPERTALAIVTIMAAASLIAQHVKQKGPTDGK